MADRRLFADRRSQFLMHGAVPITKRNGKDDPGRAQGRMLTMP